MAHFCFQTSQFVVKTVNLSLVFPENQHLLEFSPIMKVLFQRTKRGNFYTHYFIEVFRHFILKSIISRLSSWKTIIPRISLTHVLNHFLVNYIHLKLLFRMYLKGTYLLKYFGKHFVSNSKEVAKMI